MSKMFINYENNVNTCSDFYNLCSCNPTVKELYDIKGRFFGVQVKYENPFTLYFNVKNFDHTIDLGSSIVTLDILTLNNKKVLTKKFNLAEILSQETYDLECHISIEEAKNLKKESYRLNLYINNTKIFAETNCYLIIR